MDLKQNENVGVSDGFFFREVVGRVVALLYKSLCKFSEMFGISESLPKCSIWAHSEGRKYF